MAITQNPQALIDKQHKFFGSDRGFFTGATVNSGTAFTVFLNFSGTNTGIGADQQTHGNRIEIQASGGNNANVFFSFDSGTSVHGIVQPTGTTSRDGISANNITLRTDTNSQVVYVSVW